MPIAAGGGVVALGALLIQHRTAKLAARGKAPPGAPPAPGPVVQRVNTGGGASWLADRYAALQRQGITGQVAHAIVSMWALETAAGQGEWNYNVGNYTAPAGIPCYYAKPSSCAACGSGCPCWWIAYDTLDAGVADWLARFQKTWPSCWSELQSNPTGTDWISCANSYYGGPKEIASYVAGYLKRYNSLATPSA